MKIERLILGAFETNSYVLRKDETTPHCLIIDTGLGDRSLMDFLAKHELDPVAIILTHGHVDHTADVVALRDKYPQIKVCIHKLDAEMLTDPTANLSAMTGVDFSTAPAERILQHGDEIDEAGIKLKVLHTPGHTPGGICLLSQDQEIVFVGDTLFADSIGRTDFPGGSLQQILDSIRQNLFVLPDETTAYPGHGPATTIGHEKVHNPFLR